MRAALWVTCLTLAGSGGACVAIGLLSSGPTATFLTGIFALGATFFGWSMGSGAVARLYRRAGPSPYQDGPDSKATPPNAARYRRSWTAIYGVVSVLGLVTILLSIFVVVPAFEVNYLSVVPAPSIDEGPMENILVQGPVVHCAQPAGSSASCPQTVWIGETFRVSIMVVDFSTGGCNVTSVSLDDGFRVLGTSPELPLYVPPTNETSGISTGVSIGLELRAPQYGGALGWVGGTTFLDCS